MKYFDFFPSWIPVLKLIPETRILPFLTALAEYVENGTEPTFENEKDGFMFEYIKATLKMMPEGGIHEFEIDFPDL